MYGNLMKNQPRIEPEIDVKNYLLERLECPSYMFSGKLYPNYLSGGGFILTKVSIVSMFMLSTFTFRPHSTAYTPPHSPLLTSTSTMFS